jgi:hypothetical protein
VELHYISKPKHGEGVDGVPMRLMHFNHIPNIRVPLSCLFEQLVQLYGNSDSIDDASLEPKFTPDELNLCMEILNTLGCKPTKNPNTALQLFLS